MEPYVMVQNVKMVGLLQRWEITSIYLRLWKVSSGLSLSFLYFTTLVVDQFELEIRLLSVERRIFRVKYFPNNLMCLYLVQSIDSNLFCSAKDSDCTCSLVLLHNIYSLYNLTLQFDS